MIFATVHKPTSPWNWRENLAKYPHLWHTCPQPLSFSILRGECSIYKTYYFKNSSEYFLNNLKLKITYIQLYIKYDTLLLFSHQVVSDSLRPHGLKHVRLLCPSLSLWVCSNSCPLSQWYHSTISSSVAPFSSCPQSFLALRSFPESNLHIR